MILHCTYEELTAATAGAEYVLAAEGGSGSGVLAPPEAIAVVEALLPRLTGSITMRTLDEQQTIEHALSIVLDTLHELMNRSVLEYYVGAEEAVIAYFDYAHVLTLWQRASQIGREMAAIIELVTGRPPDTETATGFVFSD
jgi:hypothetical protein